MGKFKAGDRIAVYDYTREVGKVTTVFDDDEEIIGVWFDIDSEEHVVHVKQCRRLKPKIKPREIFINEYDNGLNEAHYLTKEDAKINKHRNAVATRRFREVIEKKK